MNEEIELDEFAPWLVVILTFIGGGLRVLLLGMKGMWLDETFSVWLASHPVPEMLSWLIKIDQHPPLYYGLLHYWIALTDNTPYNVRLLSVLLGTGTIPLVYLIGKRMSGVVMGLAAAIFLVFSPFHIAYAQETRMYTLLTFNAAAALYALVVLLTDARSTRPIGSQFRDYFYAWRTPEPVKPIPTATGEFRYNVASYHPTGWRAWFNRHRWLPLHTISTDLAWVALIIFSAATMLSHNTAVLFPLATNAFVFALLFFQRGKKAEMQPAFHAPSLANWIKAQLGIFLLWSPWLLAFIQQARAVSQRFWIPEPTWDAIVQVVKTFLNAAAPLPANQALIVWSLYGLMLAVGVFYFRKKLSQLFFLVALFAIPFLSELLVSLWRPIFWDRTLIWITIPLFLLLAAGVAQLKFRFLMISAVGILGTINLMSAGDYYRFFQKEDWNSAAGYVANFAEKDDLVLFNSNFVVIPFDYYFKTYEDLYAIEVEKQGVPLDLFDSGILEPEMTASDIPALLALLRGHNRVWLVYSHDSYTDPEGLIPPTLAAEMTLIRERNFHGGQVQLYENP